MRMHEYFDHTVLLVRDLGAAAKGFERLGFSVFDREDTGGSMENRLVRFTDGSFIELVAFREPGKTDAHRFYPMLAKGDGWIDYAVNTAAITATGEALEKATGRGFGIKPVAKMGNDGREWRMNLLVAGLGVGDMALPFLTEDLTPSDCRVPRQPKALAQPFGVTGTAGVTAITRDLAAIEGPLKAIYRAGRAVRPRFEGAARAAVYEFNGRWVEVVEPDASASGLRDHLERRGGGVYEVTLAATSGGDGTVLDTSLTSGARVRLSYEPMEGYAE